MQRLRRREHAGHHAAAHAADAETGWLFGGEDDEFDGASGLESELLEDADGFEAAQHADASVVEAGVGNGVDVGAGADGRKVRVGALPAGEGVADGVFGDGETGVGAQAFHVGTSAQVGLAEDDARHDRGLGFGDLSQRLEFGDHAIDTEFGADRGRVVVIVFTLRADGGASLCR